MRFCKNPVVVEAEQYLGFGRPLIPGVSFDPVADAHYVVTIHQQKCYILPGDWIIQEPDGVHYYPCKPDIFESNYTKA